MKKIILVLIFLLLTGCDYIEPDKLAIVSTIGIDYQKDYFYLTIEIEEVKTKDTESSYIIEVKSNSLNEAFNKINKSLDKTLYFANLDMLLLTPDALDAMDKIIKHINNDYQFSHHFNLALVNNPHQIIDNMINKDLIAGYHLRNILKSKEHKNNDITYTKFLENYLDYKIILPAIVPNKDLLNITLVEVIL